MVHAQRIYFGLAQLHHHGKVSNLKNSCIK
jgi:hypothetical protein